MNLRLAKQLASDVLTRGVTAATSVRQIEEALGVLRRAAPQFSDSRPEQAAILILEFQKDSLTILTSPLKEK